MLVQFSKNDSMGMQGSAGDQSMGSDSTGAAPPIQQPYWIQANINPAPYGMHLSFFSDGARDYFLNEER